MKSQLSTDGSGLDHFPYLDCWSLMGSKHGVIFMFLSNDPLQSVEIRSLTWNNVLLEIVSLKIWQRGEVNIIHLDYSHHILIVSHINPYCTTILVVKPSFLIVELSGENSRLFWVSCKMPLTWRLKACSWWIPKSNSHDFRLRSQWGHYNLPRLIHMEVSQNGATPKSSKSLAQFTLW